jgi:hypothetical protein
MGELFAFKWSILCFICEQKLESLEQALIADAHRREDISSEVTGTSCKSVIKKIEEFLMLNFVFSVHKIESKS